MEVDFIHVGFHKTATTWLQFYGFRENPDIVMYNDSLTNLDLYFVRNFVYMDEEIFDTISFEKKFNKEIRQIHGDISSKITGIIEENLSGHYWSGNGQAVLAERIRNVFGETKIIISIRNQIDMLSSLYSNYIKADSGTKSLANLLHDKSIYGDKVFHKLCYDEMISNYISLFGRENILVICYEDFENDQVEVFNKMLKFVGAKPTALEIKTMKARVNSRYSVPSEIVLRIMNWLGVRNRFSDKLLFLLDRFLLCNRFKRDRKSLFYIITSDVFDRWKKSNKKLKQLNVEITSPLYKS